MIETVSNNIFGIVWNAGIQILIFLAALQNIPVSAKEAAQMEGATAWEYFWKITIPLIRPILSFVLVTSMIGGLQMYDVPALLTKDQGNPKGKALTIIMEVQLRKDSGVGKASAVCIAIFIVSAILGIILMFGMNDDKPKKKKKKRRAA
jgi:multiple sugar transport system permease protein